MTVRVRHQTRTERYFTFTAPRDAGAPASKPPPMLHNPRLMPIPRYSKRSRGLFVTSALNEHLYSYVCKNFADSWSRQWGRYAIRAGRTYPTRNFATLGWLWLPPPLPGLNSPLRKKLTDPLNLPAPGRRQSVSQRLAPSHAPVFLVTVSLPLACATPAAHHRGVSLMPRHRCNCRVP